MLIDVQYASSFMLYKVLMFSYEHYAG